MRSFLESLDSEHASSAASVKVKVPAMLIDAISFEESAATLTLTWSKNTRKVQVQPLTMLDRAKEQLIKLLQTYRTYCESRKVLPPPKGGERAASMLRCPVRSDYLVFSRKWIRVKSETCNLCASGSCIRSNRRTDHYRWNASP